MLPAMKSLEFLRYYANQSRICRLNGEYRKESFQAGGAYNEG